MHRTASRTILLRKKSNDAYSSLEGTKKNIVEKYSDLSANGLVDSLQVPIMKRKFVELFIEPKS